MQPHNTTSHKTCTKCGESKPATTEYFYRQKTVRDGLRAMCKVCSAAYQAANKEYIAEFSRAHYQANKEHIDERRRMRYAANKEKELKRNRAYHAANKDKHRIRQQRRRALVSNAEGTHTEADIKAQYKRQKRKCYWCSEKLNDAYHVDHIIPLSRGGSNDASNLVISCPHCNTSRGNKLPHEWVEGGRLL